MERLSANPYQVRKIPLAREVRDPSLAHVPFIEVAGQVIPKDEVFVHVDRTIGKGQGGPLPPNKIVALHIALRDDANNPTPIAEYTIAADERGFGKRDSYFLFPDINTSLATENVLEQFGSTLDNGPLGITMYDLFSSYNSHFASLPNREEILNRYFTLLANHLGKGGYLLVQLANGTTDTNEEVAQYNQTVHKALARAGFLLGDTTTGLYPYEWVETHETGILYVFKKQDPALGEHDPEEKTAVGGWMDEVARIVNEGLPAQENEKTVRR